jgi:hypothetical protein
MWRWRMRRRSAPCAAEQLEQLVGQRHSIVHTVKSN